MVGNKLVLSIDTTSMMRDRKDGVPVAGTTACKELAVQLWHAWTNDTWKPFNHHSLWFNVPIRWEDCYFNQYMNPANTSYATRAPTT